MSSIGVGKEILSHCSKCKLILAHIIVTMKSATEADKVQCKTCKATHTFKDPSATKKKTSIDRVIKNARSAGGKKSSESVTDLWTKAMNKTTSQGKEYSTRDSFQMGDVINHPTFGQGVVEKLIDNNKIEVLFKDDYRTLMHKK
ncbi:hypothetical protein DOM21_03535 [Bacteriovorax stolpii]|uniref:Uncharacterized protein n=1 Tax=Bacteriovorax stolpii TaxID=960 RepID=A0A2K9NVC4_BACTC|nr:hypothetical protein [Bacteriovorax stolpii]AUN99469.1 hypothetical protein C0V70_15405 [Bacteriovorax stolpii]QDK40538.1 hypothetical protein DOM21_03535 [Bacteriovorax stolpii]TDP54987.1 hypothetical protein C8D79_0028 [Bacteriovorax stolpii]